MTTFKTSISITLLGIGAGAIVIACTATSSRTNCQLATVQGPVIAGLGLAQLALGTVDDQTQAGVTVTNASVNINVNGRGWSGGHFTLVNSAAKDLSTYYVTFHITDTAGETLIFSDIVDGYLPGSPLAAGKSMDVEVNTTGSFQFPVVGVSATIAYLEFADGTRYGKDSTSIYAKLAKERAQAINYAKSLATRLDQGAPEADIEAGFSLAQGDTPGVRTAKSIFRDTLQESLGATSQAIRRMAQLPVPAQQ